MSERADGLPEHVTLAELAWAISSTEAEVLAMVESGVLPPPRSDERWHWPSVDRAMAGSGETWIYFARAGDFIKIGLADVVTARIRDLQTACPLEIELLHKFRAQAHIERTLHRRFAALRVRGEWFRAEPELLQYIGSIKSQIRIASL